MNAFVGYGLHLEAQVFDYDAIRVDKFLIQMKTKSKRSERKKEQESLNDDFICR